MSKGRAPKAPAMVLIRPMMVVSRARPAGVGPAVGFCARRSDDTEAACGVASGRLAVGSARKRYGDGKRNGDAARLAGPARPVVSGSRAPDPAGRGVGLGSPIRSGPLPRRRSVRSRPGSARAGLRCKGGRVGAGD